VSRRRSLFHAYGTVVEAAFKQVVAKRGGRVVALERYPLDKAQMQGPVRNVAQAAAQLVRHASGTGEQRQSRFRGLRQ
jgi:hypothetical protein